MDNILYRNPSKSEIIGRYGGDEIKERQRITDRSQMLKRNIKKYCLYSYSLVSVCQNQADMLSY